MVQIIGLLSGAPYVRSTVDNVDIAIALLSPYKKKNIVDIGCGDGTVLMEFAKHGYVTTGYEIHPLLVLYARWNTFWNGYRGKVSVHWKDLWDVNFSEFDAVYVYGFPRIMAKLEEKLQNELKGGSVVLLVGFPFPNWKPVSVKGSVFLYEKI